jgi:hypothetical protein
MSAPIALSKVEQALVAEVAAWVERATAEIKASADQRLAVILDAHGVLGKQCQFNRTDAGWELIPPADAESQA